MKKIKNEMGKLMFFLNFRFIYNYHGTIDSIKRKLCFVIVSVLIFQEKLMYIYTFTATDIIELWCWVLNKLIIIKSKLTILEYSDVNKL